MSKTHSFSYVSTYLFLVVVLPIKFYKINWGGTEIISLPTKLRLCLIVFLLFLICCTYLVDSWCLEIGRPWVTLIKNI